MYQLHLPFEGLYLVSFTNGKEETINIEQQHTTSDALTIYLIDDKGRIYNWANIVWLQKVNER